MKVEITIAEYVIIAPALAEAGTQHTAAYAARDIAGTPAKRDDGDYEFTVTGSTTPVIIPASTPITLDMSDGVGALQSLITDLAKARETAASTASAYKQAEARWLKTEGSLLKTTKTAAEAREKKLTDMVRAFAPIIGKATGEAKPVMGVSVENFTGWAYDAAAALAWAVKRGAKAVALVLSPAQMPRLLALMLDLMEYREKNLATIEPELAYLLGKIPGFLSLDTKEYEALLKSGIYANEGIPGTMTTTPKATIDSDLSFHLTEAEEASA